MGAVQDRLLAVRRQQNQPQDAGRIARAGDYLVGCDRAPVLASQSVLRCAGVGVQMDID